MKKTKFIAVNALALALIFLFTFVTIPGLPLRLAVFVLLTVLAVSQCADFKSALFVSVSMGLVSLLANFISPVSPTSFMFRNPLISVLPRLFIGPVAFGVHRGLQRLMRNVAKKSLRDTLSSIISAICGVLTNTGLVILMITICYLGKTVEGTMINGEFFIGLISLNFAIEISINAVLVPPVVFAMRKVLGPMQKSKRIYGVISDGSIVDTSNKIDVVEIDGSIAESGNQTDVVVMGIADTINEISVEEVERSMADTSNQTDGEADSSNQISTVKDKSETVETTQIQEDTNKEEIENTKKDNKI